MEKIGGISQRVDSQKTQLIWVEAAVCAHNLFIKKQCVLLHF